MHTQVPGGSQRFLFVQRTGNRCGDKPYPPGTYNWVLRTLSDVLQITDAKGRAVRLSRTHRFRHTRLTRLAELGLPVHVLQRYAGHATPTMTMHYIAARDEHAEQAFLATAKLRADGTHIQLSSDDHDSLHLFRRADRFLPNGWCMLPPLQSCAKGNACLTCSVFVTDATHRHVLHRQLLDTGELIDRATTEFQQRHGYPMPEDNVWLTPRRAEHGALTRLINTLDAKPETPPTAPYPVQQTGRRARRADPRPHSPPQEHHMTDSRNRRTTVLTEAAKTKSENKTRDAEQAIRRLVKRGEPITFQAVQREAGVSHAFLYNHPELRQRIENLRSRPRPSR